MRTHAARGFQWTYATRSTKIKRWGSAINLICNIARVLFIFDAFMGIVGATLLFLNAPMPPDFLTNFSSNGIFNVLDSLNLLRGIPSEYAHEIQLFTFGISQLVALGIVSMYQRLVADISDGQPFKRVTAQKLRKSMWMLVALLFWDIVIAIMLVPFTLFVSYIIEYGAYLQEKADETNRIQEQLILQFAEITENKSGQTGRHVKRVSEYSRVLAEEMGLTPEQTEEVRLASMMHDIGKLLIPGEILDKPGHLRTPLRRNKRGSSCFPGSKVIAIRPCTRGGQVASVCTLYSIRGFPSKRECIDANRMDT